MKATVSSVSRLGSNCWSPARMFEGGCASCDRYDTCKYPERSANARYDQIRKRASRARTISENLYQQAKKIAGR